MERKSITEVVDEALYNERLTVVEQGRTARRFEFLHHKLAWDMAAYYADTYGVTIEEFRAELTVQTGYKA